MASGSSGRVNRSSEGFDFGSDDILCSYDDFVDQEQSKGSRSEAVIGANSSTVFHKSRIASASLFSTSYSKPEDNFLDDVICMVEKSMKKHSDNLMRFLEGISSRMSQLELYCYNIDKSIGEMRSDLARHHDDGDLKLKSLDKTVQEVHRSVQILRDKQELNETQKELAKLQLVQKGSSTSNQSQGSEDKTSSPASDPQNTKDTSGLQNQQLALALPNQVAPHQQPVPPHQQPVPPPSQASQNLAQRASYPVSHPQLPNLPVITQCTQNQYLVPDPQYHASQMQDVAQVSSQPTHSHVSQMAPQPFSQYQQQWPQQSPPMRPPPASVYPSYSPSEPSNPPPQETLPSSMQMQYSSVPQAGSRVDTMPYGYGRASRTNPQQSKTSFTAQAGDDYISSGPPVRNAYVNYESEGGRVPHPAQQAHYPPGGYPPANASPHNSNHPHQFIRNHPYRDLIEKLSSMGFRSDHVVSVIQRLEESGQTVDFNAVLDKLNLHSSSESGIGFRRRLSAMSSRPCPASRLPHGFGRPGTLGKNEVSNIITVHNLLPDHPSLRFPDARDAMAALRAIGNLRKQML